MGSKKKKILLTCTVLLIVCVACILTAIAHSGRTDSNGGHRDNNNVSGLGGYHYHCDGYPPHLHTNGACPYKTSNTTSSSNTTEENLREKYGIPSNLNDKDFKEGKAYGYKLGYKAGKESGYATGYRFGERNGEDKGYKDGYKKRKEEEKNVAYVVLAVAVLAFVAISSYRFAKRKKHNQQ